jgi:putative ABC transport system substrate-binding protein
MKRRAFLGVLGAAPWFASVPYSPAQDTVPKIGYLTPNVQGVPFEQGFHQGLHELGYSEGSSIIIEWRRAKDREDLAAPLAFELAQRQVDLIVTVGTSAARAALDATATIPIVFLSGAPVSSGLTTSMARPDRNATGISLLTSELFQKRLEYLHWLAPQARRIAYLVVPSNALSASQIEAVQKAAHLLGLQLVRLDARDPGELDVALRAIPHSETNAVLIGGDSLIYSNMAKVARAVRRAKLPAIFPYADYRDYGALMCYGPDTKETGRKMAAYVDKILKGARPADLPIEEISTYKLIIDLRVAHELGINVPQKLLYRADEVIR